MALITNIPATWSADETLGKRTLFQVRSGQVMIATGGTPGDDDGIEMDLGDALELEAGVTVAWRRKGNVVANLAREELEP